MYDYEGFTWLDFRHANWCIDELAEERACERAYGGFCGAVYAPTCISLAARNGPEIDNVSRFAFFEVCSHMRKHMDRYWC